MKRPAIIMLTTCFTVFLAALIIGGCASRVKVSALLGIVGCF
jgi:hypothetical protein